MLDILLFHRGKSYGLFNCAWIQNHINMPLDKIILRVVQLLCQRKVAMHGGIWQLRNFFRINIGTKHLNIARELIQWMFGLTLVTFCLHCSSTEKYSSVIDVFRWIKLVSFRKHLHVLSLFLFFSSDAIKFYGLQDVSLTFTFSVTLHVKIYDDMIILWHIFLVVI